MPGTHPRPRVSTSALRVAGPAGRGWAVSEPVDCAAVRELAPELALGLLSGRERAAALVHLERCESCRLVVAELASVSDSLLLTAPDAEPRPGFESRVLDRLASARTPSSRRPQLPRLRWREAIAWLVAAASLVALAGVGLGGDGFDREVDAGVRMAPMRTDDGEKVGAVFLRSGDGGIPSWLYVSLPGWTRWSGGQDEVRYTLRLDLADGNRQTFTELTISERHQSWGTDLAVDAADVLRVTVLGEDGAVWCWAELS